MPSQELKSNPIVAHAEEMLKNKNRNVELLFQTSLKLKQLATDTVNKVVRDELEDFMKIFFEYMYESMDDPRHHGLYLKGDEDTLFEAALHGELSKVKECLGSGTNIHLCDDRGRTLIHAAAISGNKELLTHLIGMKLTVHAKTYQGNTPLHLAPTSEIAAILLDAGANIDELNYSFETPLITAISDSKNFILEIEKPNRKCVADCLIDKGANVNIEDNYDFSPFYIAACKGYIDTMEKLAAKGADIQGTKKQPLYGAVVGVVLDAGPNVTTIRKMLQLGCDINATTNLRATLLSWVTVAKRYYPELLDLFATPQNLAATDPMGNRPIHGVVCRLQMEILKHFVEIFRVDLNVFDNEGNTPLHKLAEGDYTSSDQAKLLEVAKYLLKHGADYTIKNNDGKTPADLARHYNSDIAAYLRSLLINCIPTRPSHAVMYTAKKDGHIQKPESHVPVNKQC